MENKSITSGYEGVKRLSKEDPDWLPIVEAALEVSKSQQVDYFAGSYVFDKAKKKGIGWFPNLKKLVKYEILKHQWSSHGGRRAYYSIPDPDGVEQALKELKSSGK